MNDDETAGDAVPPHPAGPGTTAPGTTGPGAAESTMDGPEAAAVGTTAPGRLPSEFARRELESVRARRRALGLDLSDAEACGRVGLAISGGGIRSATFGLGVLQALARHQRLRHVDYLSTVSGGGYVGAFLGSLYLPPGARGEAPASDEPDVPDVPTTPATGGIPANVERVEGILADDGSPPLRWLREHGRYITPRGGGDVLYAAAVYLRNWVSLHYVFAVTVLTALLAVNLSRALLWERQPWLRDLESWLFAMEDTIWWSPWFMVPLAGLLLVLVPLGWAYWLTQTRQDAGHVLRNPALVATLLVALGAAYAWHRATAAGVPWTNMPAVLAAWLVHAPAAATLACLAARLGAGNDGVARNRLSRWLAGGLALVLLAAAGAMVDSLGQTLYWLTRTGHAFGWATLLPLASTVVLLVQRFAPAIDQLGGSETGLRVPASMVLSALGFVLFAALLVAWSAVSHALLWAGSCVDCAGETPLPRAGITAVALGALIIITILTARTLPFLNLSTLAQFYATRLARAYLGACHPGRSGYRNPAAGVGAGAGAREAAQDAPLRDDVTQASPRDEIRWHAYRPDLHGGPLHFVNVTVNETVFGASQLAQRDRKGLPMAVGPIGVSVGRHHARWDGSDARLVPLATMPDPATPFATAPGESREVEPLMLGQWMAISGAAFSTGLGARTRMGLSMLLALSNARLGYWWDSGVAPKRPAAPGPRGLRERLFARLATLAPVQAGLAAETFARFHGTRRRRWHLSDGGHFENTGVYELIRRRVPFIIVCDDGQDQDDRFEDIGNLVRKARIDWGVEVSFLTTDEIAVLVGVDSPLRASIGTPAQLRRGTGADVPDAASTATSGAAATVAVLAGPRRAERRACLAWARYGDDPRARSLLLFLRPALLGDEPLDLLEYAARNPDFPQQSTADQSFDEAQWESYRRLGEHTGDQLFTARAVSGHWAPRSMCAPSAAASSR